MNMTNPSIHYKYGADVGFFPTAMYKYRKEVSLFQFVKNQPIKPIRSLQLIFSHQPNRLAGVMAMMLASSDFLHRAHDQQLTQTLLKQS